MTDVEQPWELMPDEDEPDRRPERAAEEAALHVEPSGSRAATDPGRTDVGLDERSRPPRRLPDDDDRQLDVAELIERQHYDFAREPGGRSADLPVVTAALRRHEMSPAEVDRWQALLESERVRLDRLRSGLRAEVAEGEPWRDQAGELSGNDQHAADIASETFEVEKERSLLSSVEAELQELEAAFARLADGTYGRCLACGGQIPDARLEAVPFTRYCVGHEAQAEHTAAPRPVAGR